MNKKISSEKSVFWKNEDQKLKILHSNLIAFLEEKGFMRVKLDDTNYLLVRESNNMISMTTETEAIGVIKDYLIGLKLYEVYELFAKGIGSYISGRKLDLLKSVELLNDRDTRTSSTFYFRNCYCTIDIKSIRINDYKDLPKVIWKNRVIDRNFTMPNDVAGQFEIFCSNICGYSEERIVSLKSILGYLLHRNKDRGETVAIIFYDEKMGLNNQAHGGTGKTLLSQALAECREVESFDGKEIKTGSWFKNQRINITTDVLVYDDLNRAISLKNFYSMVTTGIEIEKKRQQAFFIDFKKSPKVLITSNYVVKGTGGSSDKRRRFEFELNNYYSDKFDPEMEFGNRFFDDSWGNEEWSKFYLFMMECLQCYLEHGLIIAKPLNLNRAKIIAKSCDEFHEYVSYFLEFNNWVDKREFEDVFAAFYPHKGVSPHMMRKWLSDYAIELGSKLEIKNSGGKYYFRIKREVVK